MRDVVIAGASMTTFGKFLDRNVKSLVTEAVDGALADSCCPADEVEMVYFANVLGGLMQNQESTRGQIWLSQSPLVGITVVNIENACASGSAALHQAWLSVASGLVDVAVAVGAEKMHDALGSGRALNAIRAAVDQDRLDSIQQELGSAGPSKSLFMDIYAEFTRRYVERTDANQEDFARVAVKNHQNAARNPKVQYNATFTVEEVLAARTISGQLTLPMCAPIADGAAAVVLTSAEKAAKWGAYPTRILGVALGAGLVGTYGEVVPNTAKQAYALAGIAPSDVDVVECHDAAAPAEMIAMEELGLCAPGDGPKLVRAGETTISGRLPVNPSGGLEGKGHPLGATGLAQLVELSDQLRDRCGDRQVEEPRIALSENAGGYLGPDVATVAVTILGRA